MERSWPFGLFVALLAVAYFTFRLGLGLGAASPDLLTLAVLLGARRLNGGAAAALGFGLGLLRDAVALIGFGSGVIVLTLLGYAGARSRDLFVGDSLLFTGIYLVAGKYLHDGLYYLLAGRTFEVGAARALLVDAPLASLYAAAAGVVAVFAYRVLTGER